MQNYSGDGDGGNDYDDRIAIMGEGEEKTYWKKIEKHKKLKNINQAREYCEEKI